MSRGNKKPIGLTVERPLYERITAAAQAALMSRGKWLTKAALEKLAREAKAGENGEAA